MLLGGMMRNNKIIYCENIGVYTRKLFRGKKHVFWSLFCILILTSCNDIIAIKTHPKKKTTQLQLNGFSPDGKNLSFDKCRKHKCEPTILEIDTGKLIKFNIQDKDLWLSSGRFSPDGGYIVFVVKRKSEKYRWSQLGKYDLTKHSLKILTKSKSYKAFPSFSPDGSKIIYASPGRERKRGATRHSRWDIYELEIQSGKEQQLTHYEFFLIGRPFYMPDGKQFIYSGDSPRFFNKKVGMEAIKEFKSSYRGNSIFRNGPGIETLKPVFMNGPLTMSPGITYDGAKISYIARSDEMNRADGIQTYGYKYDIFIFENGKHSRVTNLASTFRLDDYVMSSDGKLIAYTSETKKKGTIRLWLIDLENDQKMEINLNHM